MHHTADADGGCSCLSDAKPWIQCSQRGDAVESSYLAAAARVVQPQEEAQRRAATLQARVRGGGAEGRHRFATRRRT